MTVGDPFCLERIVSYPDYWGALPATVRSNDFFNLGDVGNVEACGGLVQQKSLGLITQKPQQGETLPLAGRKATYLPAKGFLLEAQPVEELMVDAREVLSHGVEPPLTLGGEHPHSFSPCRSFDALAFDAVQEKASFM
jgi:hypothetical protein